MWMTIDELCAGYHRASPFLSSLNFPLPLATAVLRNSWFVSQRKIRLRHGSCPATRV